MKFIIPRDTDIINAICLILFLGATIVSMAQPGG